MAIRVLIADDHEVARAGLQFALDMHDIEIVATAASGKEAVAQAIKHRPQVALVDVRMEDSDGLCALREIREHAPDVAVVMLSMYSNPTYVARANAWGASEYLFKTASGSELADAIRRAANGEPIPRQSPLSRLRELLGRREKDVALPLTKRQVQVLRFLGLGLENREIAMSLGISVDTVKEHVRCVLRALELKDRTQAAVWATSSGFMSDFEWDTPKVRSDSRTRLNGPAYPLGRRSVTR